MSYPPQPGQDPNNPYAQPQQPAYGYPQQHGLPSYGGPAEQGYPMGAGGPGYGVPMAMPSGVKAARIMLWVVGGLGILGALALFVVAALFEEILDEAGATTTDADVSVLADMGAGLMAVLGVLALVYAGLGIFLAAKFANGGNGVRIGTIVYAAFLILGGVANFPTGIVHLVLGILINRPRY